MKHLALGDVNISRIIESEGPFVQPQQLLPDAKNEIIESHKHWLAPNFLRLVNGKWIPNLVVASL